MAPEGTEVAWVLSHRSTKADVASPEPTLVTLFTFLTAGTLYTFEYGPVSCHEGRITENTSTQTSGKSNWELHQGQRLQAAAQLVGGGLAEHRGHPGLITSIPLAECAGHDCGLSSWGGS